MAYFDEHVVTGFSTTKTQNDEITALAERLGVAKSELMRVAFTEFAERYRGEEGRARAGAEEFVSVVQGCVDSGYSFDDAVTRAEALTINGRHYFEALGGTVTKLWQQIHESKPNTFLAEYYRLTQAGEPAGDALAAASRADPDGWHGYSDAISGRHRQEEDEAPADTSTASDFEAEVARLVRGGTAYKDALRMASGRMPQGASEHRDQVGRGRRKPVGS